MVRTTDQDSERPISHEGAQTPGSSGMTESDLTKDVIDVEEVKERIAEIHKHRWDPEVAHEMEDKLFRDVLKAIGDGDAWNPMVLAYATLKSREVGFARWYS